MYAHDHVMGPSPSLGPNSTMGTARIIQFTDDETRGEGSNFRITKN
uniref:Uncharacterized protein n=1 Tax=Rhizophora mucronata TaxID=61149 RepID=A0A2P2NC12_RHIMU